MIIRLNALGVLLLLLLSLSANSMAANTTAPATTQPSHGVIDEGFALSLSASESKLNLGTLAEVVVTIENKSNTKSSFRIAHALRDVRLFVDDSEGRRIPFTRFGLWYENRDKWPGLSSRIVELAPGEQYSVRMHAGLFFDMSLPGEYIVYAEFRVPRRGSGTADPEVPIRSNSLRLSVSSDPVPHAPAKP